MRDPIESAAESPLLVAAVSGGAQVGSWLRSALRSAGVVAEVTDVADSQSAARHVATAACDAIVAIDSPALDAAALVAGLRGGGYEGSFIAVGETSAIEREGLVLGAGADAYRCASVTSPALLAGDLVRAVAARRLATEHRRLASRERQRLEADRDDVQRVLEEQRQLVGELEGFALHPIGAPSRAPLCPERPDPLDLLRERYTELVRDAVSLGGAGVAQRVAEVAEELVGRGCGAPTAIEFHLHAVERLLAGLGGRGARQSLSRADVVAMDLVVHLAERYRAGYVAGASPLAPPNRLAA